MFESLFIDLFTNQRMVQGPLDNFEYVVATKDVTKMLTGYDTDGNVVTENINGYLSRHPELYEV